MVPAFMYFMLLVSCLRVSSQDGNGQLCMNCKNLKNPGECTQITRCGIHEQCFMSQYMRNGQLYYDLGCQDNTLCSKLSGVFGRRANPGLDNYEDDVTSVVCVACCNDTICNIGGLCNVPAFNQHGGRVCFNCKDATSPDGCRHIKLCGIDRQCYIHQKIDPNTFNFEWESGCAESAGHCTRSSAYFCRQCCSGNLCNSRCSRTHVTHPTQHAKIHLNQGGTCFDDAHTNCTEYAYKTICDRYGQYVKWAKLKCPATCGYCIAPTVTVNCIDAKPNCAEYEHAMCTEDQYRVFRELNCRRFCGVCHGVDHHLLTQAP